MRCAGLEASIEVPSHGGGKNRTGFEVSSMHRARFATDVSNRIAHCQVALPVFPCVSRNGLEEGLLAWVYQMFWRKLTSVTGPEGGSSLSKYF